MASRESPVASRQSTACRDCHNVMFRTPSSVLAIALLAAGCSRVPATPSAPAIAFNTSDPQHAFVEVTGLSAADRTALTRARLTSDEWSAVFRVVVKADGPGSAGELPAVAGRYGVDDSVRFIPLFPLDPGREYEVVFDPSRVARTAIVRVPAARAVVALPPGLEIPSTVVTDVYPSGDVIPENQLRMYVQFSKQMGQDSGFNHVALFDRNGDELVDAMLPLDTELWSADRTRYTILFDPGRVKRAILPNREMGRALRKGESVTLVIKRSWRDGQGQPLESEYRKQYHVVSAIERPLDTSEWRVIAPSAATRDRLAMTFPSALDRALLERSLSVTRSGVALAGQWHIEQGETRCQFVPRDSWQPGDHAIVVSPVLEDVSGNRIGRAFEVMSPGEAVPPESSRPTLVPFRVPPATNR
jgi:hypothetical protein